MSFQSSEKAFINGLSLDRKALRILLAIPGDRYVDAYELAHRTRLNPRSIQMIIRHRLNHLVERKRDTRRRRMLYRRVIEPVKAEAHRPEDCFWFSDGWCLLTPSKRCIGPCTCFLPRTAAWRPRP